MIHVIHDHSDEDFGASEPSRTKQCSQETRERTGRSNLFEYSVLVVLEYYEYLRTEYPEYEY
mgnify:CR=1 FL=1